MFPAYVLLKYTQKYIRDTEWSLFKKHEGKPFPEEHIAKAKEEIEEFCRILEAEGVTVRRPEVNDFSRSYSTPDFSSPGGFHAAMPRDILLVIGEEINVCR